MKSIIEVNHLSKKYKYGESQSYYTLRDSLTDFAKHPFGIGRAQVGLGKDEFWALKDVSFKINQGEAVGIIGPNGAGKSTLLKILSRITPPTSGEAILRGRVGSLLEVGTGFQQELTGRENIYLNGAILGMTRREINKKFDEIVDFSGVEKFLDTPVKHYSSGMYMRLAFAVAANLESEILIVDEVLAVGDAEFQKKCLGKMDEVAKKEGRTVLFVSHNMGSIKSLCSRGILLKNGKVLLDGNAGNAIDMYYKEMVQDGKKFQKIVTPKIDILDIYFTDKFQKKIKYIDTDIDFSINIFYKIKKKGFYGLTLSLLKDGAFVFQTINNQNDSEISSKSCGVYESVCNIPGGFLNDGRYSLTLNIHEKNYTNSVDYNGVCSFEVRDGVKVRGNYFGGFQGVIRPKLNWSDRKIIV